MTWCLGLFIPLVWGLCEEEDCVQGGWEIPGVPSLRCMRYYLDQGLADIFGKGPGSELSIAGSMASDQMHSSAVIAGQHTSTTGRQMYGCDSRS